MSVLEITKLRRDGGTQLRCGIYTETVEEYAAAIEAGGALPPVVVFYDGSEYWLADGFHRTLAHEKAGRSHIAVDVRQGACRDAVLHSAGANSIHGLPRTRHDKRRAVETLLFDDEWSKWSDNEIARKTATSQPFVGKVRSSYNIIRQERTFERGGTVSTMNTAAIGITAEEAERREKAAAEKAAGEARAAAAQEIAAAQALLAEKDRILKASTANEKRVIDERDAARAEADKAKATADELKIDKANLRDQLATIAEKVELDTTADVTDRFEGTINKLTREAEQAKADAITAKAEAVLQAEALAKAKLEKMISDRKAELNKIDQEAQKELARKTAEVKALEKSAERAQANSTRAYEAEQRAKASLAEIQAAQSALASAEAELAEQLKFATEIAEFIGEKMSDLGMFESTPTDSVARKVNLAADRCEQFAAALRTWMAPRLVHAA